MIRGTRDHWERLVGAVLDREELRRIAHCESLSTSVSNDFSSRLSFGSVDEALGIPGNMLEQGADSDAHGAVVPLIKFKELKKATKNFHHAMWLGHGAFGPVFKGWINELTLRASKPGSGIVVAVSRRSDGEYEKEKYLSRLRHPNLVNLIGCCCEEGNMFLVYEFMQRGSLDNHLFTRGHQSLSWATRMKVARGAAKAMSFLHDLPTPVIHRVCQCSNVLLDDDFNPKLIDFGLARDGPVGGTTHVSTRVVSAYGVVAPEYLITGKLTEKADVFSFGVVLLELLSGRRVFDINQSRERQDLMEWANKRKMLQIMDTRLQGQYPHNESYAVAKLACRCLSKTPVERPRMSEVVVALQQLE